MALRRSTAWIDVSNRTRQTILTSVAGAPATALALAAKSNAAELNHFEGPYLPAFVVVPSNLQYSAVADYAALLFADAAGETAQITLPAPQLGIFQADGMTVNSAAIAALIAAVGLECLSASGGLLTTFLGGVRRGQRPNG